MRSACGATQALLTTLHGGALATQIGLGEALRGQGGGGGTPLGQIPGFGTCQLRLNPVHTDTLQALQGME